MRSLRAAEFLNGNEIDPEPPTELPAVINVKLPEACTHLNLNYTCTGEYKVMINMLMLGKYLYFPVVGCDTVWKQTTKIQLFSHKFYVL